MKPRLTIFAALLVLSISTVSATTQQTRLGYGEKLSFQDYEVRYGASNGDTSLTIGRWTDTSFLVIKEIQGIDIYESVGESFRLSANTSIEIVSTGHSDQGRFVKLSISSTEDIFSSGTMTSSTPENLIIQQGESADIPLTLENTGFVNQSYSLGYETNSSLKVSYSFQNFNVTDVYIPAGEQNSVTATVSVPETARIGTHVLRLTAGKGTELSETFKVEVRGREVEKEISMDIDERFKQVSPGGKIQMPVTVTNGAGFYGVEREGPELRNVTFNIAVPDGWEYELNPSRFQTLEYRDRRRAMLTVEVPENAQTGDFFVDISVSSNEASLEEPVQLRVNVKQKSKMGYIGVFLMLLSFGMLVVVYRKFGRR
ncbi:MAG: NEW3 domain-containing protein [Candidatus Nanohaloarchaea archaeon]